MNVKELLNTDLEVIGAWLRQGFHWWVDELLQMVPARWQTRLERRRDHLALVDGARISIRDGRGNLTDPGSLSAAQRRLDVVLSSNLVLTRMIDLPAMRLPDLQKTVRLELDRLTPFSPATAYFDTEIIHRSDAAGTQKVRIGVLPRAAGERIMALLASEQIEPVSLRVGGPVPGSIGGFDFLSSIREASGARTAASRARVLWAVVAALLVINVGVLIYRDAAGLGALREITASQENVVTIARRLREKVDSEAVARGALGKERAQTAPLPLLDAVTRALPADAWVQRFEWDGKRLRIAGYGGSANAVLSALRRMPALRSAKPNGPQRTAAAAGAKQPFDIAIDATGVAR